MKPLRLAVAWALAVLARALVRLSERAWRPPPEPVTGSPQAHDAAAEFGRMLATAPRQSPPVIVLGCQCPGCAGYRARHVLVVEPLGARFWQGGEGRA